jgi:hypothetical protein
LWLVLPTGHWDKLIHWYKAKKEDKQQPYSKKRLFIPENRIFIDIDEDVDPRWGVMSWLDDNLITPTPIIALNELVPKKHSYMEDNEWHIYNIIMMCLWWHHTQYMDKVLEDNTGQHGMTVQLVSLITP